MEERFVTVGEYSKTYEAWLARDRLIAEGLRAFLDGETGHDLFPSMGLSVIRLRVPESEAARAVGILVSIGTEEAPGPASAKEAEEGVWVCSICGDGVPLDRAACSACGTSRGAYHDRQPGPVRTGRPRSARGETTDAIQKKEEGTTAEAPEPAPLLPEEEEVDLPPLETFQGDDLARRAFLAALFGLILAGGAFVSLLPGVLSGGVFCLYSLWTLGRLFLHAGEVSSAGLWHMVGAAVLNIPTLLLWLMLARSLWG
jgi:hypothetical protein